jgi:hypothetical protein
MYISFDDGANWQPFQLNLPVVPITDLVIHKRDQNLVAATQGRAFWVLDDLPALRQLADVANTSGALLLKPGDTYRMRGGGFPLPPTATLGRNPSNGAIVYYYLKDKPTSQVTLEFADAAGKTIRKFTSRAPEKPAQQGAPGTGAPPTTAPEQPQAPSGEEVEEGFSRGSAPSRIPAEQGMNRFIWDMRYPDASRFPGMILWGGETRGPLVTPGIYHVKLTVDGKTQIQTFEIKKDPRLSTTNEEFAKQFDLLMKIHDKLTETNNAILQIRDVRAQVNDLMKRVSDTPNTKTVADTGKALNAKITAIEEALYQTKNRSSQDPLNYPIKLNNKLAALGDVVASADAAPTMQAYTVYENLVTQIDVQLQRLREVMQNDLSEFNKVVRDQSVPAIIVKPARESGDQR